MNHIEEAKRYVENARQLLSEKAGKEDGIYQDTKYVKLAGHAAYTGILVALDGLFGKKGKGRKDVDWYKQQLAGVDRKQLGQFVAAYDTLHLSMSYDGNPSADVAQAGLRQAESLINWVATKANA
ncbi:hypothetical protein GCM10023187_12270 [Nibrella viscosa]|uniref:DUF5618 domain-containing protein n=1 Tax=Nibrella viscosa TaxID=1084524 RepID=A0ABP8K3A0_9BACT